MTGNRKRERNEQKVIALENKERLIVRMNIKEVNKEKLNSKRTQKCDEYDKNFLLVERKYNQILRKLI